MPNRPYSSASAIDITRYPTAPPATGAATARRTLGGDGLSKNEQHVIARLPMWTIPPARTTHCLL